MILALGMWDLATLSVKADVCVFGNGGFGRIERKSGCACLWERGISNKDNWPNRVQKPLVS